MRRKADPAAGRQAGRPPPRPTHRRAESRAPPRGPSPAAGGDLPWVPQRGHLAPHRHPSARSFFRARRAARPAMPRRGCGAGKRKGRCADGRARSSSLPQRYLSAHGLPPRGSQRRACRAVPQAAMMAVPVSRARLLPPERSAARGTFRPREDAGPHRRGPARDPATTGEGSGTPEPGTAGWADGTGVAAASQLTPAPPSPQQPFNDKEAKFLPLFWRLEVLWQHRGAFAPRNNLCEGPPL